MGDILYAALEWYKVVKDRIEWLEKGRKAVKKWSKVIRKIGQESLLE
jgi:hypothetical protein